NHRALPFQSPILSAESNERFLLTILQSEYSNAFSLSTRQLHAGEQFDVFVDNADVLKNSDHIMLHIEAESESTSRRGLLELNIQVLKDAPSQIFDSEEYSFEMPIKMKNAIVGTLKLINGATVDGMHFTLYGSASKYFSLNPKRYNTIELLSSECPSDCPKILQRFVLMVRAQPKNEPSRSYDVPISISLTDGSGVAPKFTSVVIPLNLHEQSTMENLVIMETTNPDSDKLTFSLGSHDSIFDIDAESGILSVIDAQHLTVENLGERFNVTVAVSNGANEVDTAVVMVSLEPRTDLESSAPKFTQEVYAFAASPGSSFVGRISAGGADRDVTYRISEGSASLFQLNATDGRIFYRGPMEKNARNYTLKVIALDSSSPPQIDVASVQILIAGLGSSPAKFVHTSPVTVIVNKDVNAGALLHRFKANDDDPNAKIFFAMQSLSVFDENGNEVADPSEYFEYFRFSNEGTKDGALYLARSFKNTTLMAVHAQLTVADDSHRAEPEDRANIVIRLMLPEERVSDSKLLKFERVPKVVIVPEDIPVGSYVYTVNVKPILSHFSTTRRVTYSLSEGHRMFTVNPTTGVISTVTSLCSTGDSNVTVIANQVDSQTSAGISFLVRATPSPRRNMLRLAADSFVFNVTENSSVGTVITTAIGPADQSNITYRIFGTDSAFFRIDNQSAIYTALDVDRETRARLSAFVYALHSNDQISIIPITVNVLDENDVEPQFPNRSYAATVMENSPINTFIVKAQAMDADDSELDYSLMMNTDSAGLSSLLAVDGHGTIRNVEPLLGLEGNYQFAIIARDGKHSGASATIFLTILPTSKCQPMFAESSPTVFEIKENEEPPKFLAQFIGEVPSDECELTYAIWDGNAYVNETEFFTMKTDSGELLSRKAFDYEQKNRHSLVVAAQSGELFAQLDVEIRVVDVSDNRIELIDRIIRFNVVEDEQRGTIVGKVRANDRDVNDTIYYHLSNGDGKFDIGLMDGVLSLKDQLDRERNDSYELKVIVTNSKEAPTNDDITEDTATATVYITVLDVNDNGPIFDKELYIKAVSRTSLAGTKLLSVRASDPDLTNGVTPNGDVVVYRIDDTVYRYLDRTRQANGFVTINERTGEVSLGQAPKEFAGGVFESRIASSDISNSDIHIATSKLKLWIYDEMNVVELEIDGNAKDLQTSQVESLMNLLSELCECEVLLLGVGYGSSDGRILRQSVRAHFIFVNRTDDSIMPSERAISIVDRKAVDPKAQVPKLSAVQQAENTSRPLAETATRTNEAALLLCVFAFLLISVLIIFGLILCYHRSRFLRAKKMYEDEKIAAGCLNKSNRYKQPPPYVSPPVYNLK
uniref:Cadherin domain-containing protein n=1 Tax=Parascaris univalens TaxID=6257 RepID=A0A915AFR7_PARUN